MRIARNPTPDPRGLTGALVPYNHDMASRATLLILASISAAAGQPTPGARPWPLPLTAIESPASPDSGEPQLTASSTGVILSWIERSGQTATLKFALRTASGWNAARVVASGADWFVNWADVPSVMRLDDGTLAAHWLQKSGSATYAYDVKLSYSRDDGNTWSAPFTPHRDGTRTEHGFASLLQLPKAGLGVLWLDGRATSPGGHGAHGAASGAMTLQFASFDREWKQTAETPVDLRVCDCCPTAAAVTAEGIVAVFRDRTEAEVRDISISRLEHGRWSPPTTVHNDNWKIQACPVNGPAIAARGRDVVVAWFSAVGDEPRSFVAFSKDAGRTFGAPIRLDDGVSLGRVDVELLPGGAAVAAYIEHAEGRGQFRVRRVEPGGQRSVPVTVAGVDAGRTSGYPRIAVHGRELTAAWVERAGTRRVMTASALIP
jgi:hypothetical protein